MKERKVDLFETIYEDGVDAICITTNGQFTRDGRAVMGGGCAGICATRWPATSLRLGKCLKNFMTNVPFVIGAVDAKGNYLEPNLKMIKERQFKCLIFSFPTLNNIMDGSNIDLIQNSAKELKILVDKFDLRNIILPRPGCGIGSLDYYKTVRPELIKMLDDRFTIVCQENDEFYE